jgi:phage terminase large subunit-like protein
MAIRKQPTTSLTRASIERWTRDPVACISECFIDPESGKPYVLYTEQRKFLGLALTRTKQGRLPFSEMLFGAPKKSGKTCLAAWFAIYIAAFIGGRFAEVYCLSNDYEQSVGRVFEQSRRIIEASPLLRRSAKITGSRIVFTATGSFIQACASDFASFAGANSSLTIFDELWGYTSERGTRLFDEAVPVPTRAVSGRLTVTYAGFEGESGLLEGLYKRGIAGENAATDLYRADGMLTYWTNVGPAPWQDDSWRAQARLQLRPNAYLRLIENRWVSTESTFVEMEWFDKCVDAELTPELADPRLPVWVGVDASVKRDSTAIVATTYYHEFKKVRLIWHRIFQPSPKDPLDFEATVERELLALRRRFNVREVRYDPYQLVAVAQRLTQAGLPMVEFAQSVPNLTEASTNLYELIKGRNLMVYPDDEIRLAISRCVALETTRGWRIAKEKTSHKIDVIVALAQAALGAVQQASGGDAINRGELMLAPSSRWSERWSGTSREARSHQAELDREDGIALTTGSRFSRSRRGMY